MTPDQHDFSSLTLDQLILYAVEFETQRYALQVEIGRRECGETIDMELSRYFRVGKLADHVDDTSRMYNAAEINQVSNISSEEFDL